MHHINHRLLEEERARQNCQFSQQSMQRLIEPTVTDDGQKARGLKFGQPRVMALLMALCLFLTLPAGFRNAQLRAQEAALLGQSRQEYKPGQMTSQCAVEPWSEPETVGTLFPPSAFCLLPSAFLSSRR